MALILRLGGTEAHPQVAFSHAEHGGKLAVLDCNRCRLHMHNKYQPGGGHRHTDMQTAVFSL